jgi:hypothetical protein
MAQKHEAVRVVSKEMETEADERQAYEESREFHLHPAWFGSGRVKRSITQRKSESHANRSPQRETSNIASHGVSQSVASRLERLCAASSVMS